MNELLMEWVENRFKRNSNGCWIWQKSIHTDGYGRGQFLTKIYLSHRLFKFLYAQATLEELQDPEKVFMHTCDVPACVNPNHIRVGSQADNIADRKAKGRTAKHLDRRDMNGRFKRKQNNRPTGHKQREKTWP
jgi:hypothetical protein